MSIVGLKGGFGIWVWNLALVEPGELGLLKFGAFRCHFLELRRIAICTESNAWGAGDRLLIFT